MRIKLYPYKTASVSARTLKDELVRRWQNDLTLGGYNSPLIISDTARRTYPESDVVINWGNSTLPSTFEWLPKDLNHPDAVKRASNKLRTFSGLASAGVPTPQCTTQRNEAITWAFDGYTVVVRHRLNAHSGEGIRLYTPEDYMGGIQISEAPLYVKYKKKRSEYRVHVFNGRVIDVQEKRKQIEFDRDDFQSKIRSHSNGWVFCREDIQPYSNVLREIALAAIDALVLDFGAVDIIYNQREDSYYVLEVNTAVGLEGSTVSIYAGAITEYVNSL